MRHEFGSAADKVYKASSSERSSLVVPFEKSSFC